MSIRRVSYLLGLDFICEKHQVSTENRTQPNRVAQKRTHKHMPPALTCAPATVRVSSHTRPQLVSRLSDPSRPCSFAETHKLSPSGAHLRKQTSGLPQGRAAHLLGALMDFNHLTHVKLCWFCVCACHLVSLLKLPRPFSMIQHRAGIF